jgi:methyl-accepting chemotaxis protein
VINEMAEQTNLLARSAAIEAARAGEQGRGYAVVANELRTLAKRTQESSGEMRKMIVDPQTVVEEAVRLVESRRGEVDDGVVYAKLANAVLAAIRSAVRNIPDMCTQIASAAAEQATVTTEINKSIVHISQLWSPSMLSAQASDDAASKLSVVAARLQGSVEGCRVIHELFVAGPGVWAAGVPIATRTNSVKHRGDNLAPATEPRP